MAEVREETRPLPEGAWRRGEGLEFDRAAFFTDAVFAIALTLLVLEIGVPELAKGQEDNVSSLLAALRDRLPKIVSFVIAFVLIGRYWIAGHLFAAQLRAVDGRYLWLLLTYLGGIAFLPFPTALVGEYEGNPISVVAFAVVLAAVSGMGTVMFAYARRAGLLRTVLPDSVYRWGLFGSASPVIVFLGTIPLPFVSPTATLVCWLVAAPLTGILVSRYAPGSVFEYFVGGDGRGHDGG